MISEETLNEAAWRLRQKLVGGLFYSAPMTRENFDDEHSNTREAYKDAIRLIIPLLWERWPEPSDAEISLVDTALKNGCPTGVCLRGFVMKRNSNSGQPDKELAYDPLVPSIAEVLESAGLDESTGYTDLGITSLAEKIAQTVRKAVADGVR